MENNVKRFDQLCCCPFCGNEEFYTTDWIMGSCDYTRRFDGKRPANNSQMYDSLRIDEGKRAYCNNCYEYIGNRESGVLGTKTIKRLKELNVYDEL